MPFGMTDTTHVPRRKSPLGQHQRDMDLLVDTLQRHASEYDLVLVPRGLHNTAMLPSVQLGPSHTGHDLDEWIEMMVGLGARGLYLVDGLRHLRAPRSAIPFDHPPTFEVHCLTGGVLHTWTE